MKYFIALLFIVAISFPVMAYAQIPSFQPEELLSEVEDVIEELLEDTEVPSSDTFSPTSSASPSPDPTPTVFVVSPSPVEQEVSQTNPVPDSQPSIVVSEVPGPVTTITNTETITDTETIIDAPGWILPLFFFLLFLLVSFYGYALILGFITEENLIKANNQNRRIKKIRDAVQTKN